VLHTQSPVAFAMSSPTFFGERPRGPIFGARAEEAPTSPPVALKWLCEVSGNSQQGSSVDFDHARRFEIQYWVTYMILISFGSSFGALKCQLVRSKQLEHNIRILTTMWRLPISRCSCRVFRVYFRNKDDQLWEELRADKGKLRTLKNFVQKYEALRQCEAD
jgi:hypothetical protein